MTKEFNKEIEDLLKIEPGANKYALWGMEFNPFPRSGTSNINGSDTVNSALMPLDETVRREVNRFIVDSLVPNQVDKSDMFISATVVGDYGSGKTQLLMYVRAKLNEIRDSHKFLKPYTLYIDNPGGSILEFMGSIIGRIGEENVRKYVWNHIIEEIKMNEEIRALLKPYEPSTSVLFPEMKDSLDPYCDANTTSYKKFLDVFLRQLNIQKKRKFDEVMGDIIQRILQEDTQDSTVAYYFYDFIASDFGINRTWEALTSGSLKQVSGKEFAVIKYIIKLLKREGYTHVFILVDEFEDLTEGRLNKGQLDNYVHNLRTLLDKQREWCLLFAMNPLALERLKKISPPLADRISVRLISLDNLNHDEVIKIMKSYLSLANYTTDIPMTEEAIEYVREICDGNPRRILKAIYALFEEAAKKSVRVMDKAFIEENIPTF